jgi:hypothetical protein
MVAVGLTGFHSISGETEFLWGCNPNSLAGKSSPTQNLHKGIAVDDPTISPSWQKMQP